MYKLYYSPGACSMAVHAVLNELNVPFEPVEISLKNGDAKKPEYLKINPRGQVPVLIEEDGTPIKEGAAIIIHLCEKHQSPLLPRDGMARTKALEWLCWCNATLHPAYGRVLWLNRNLPDGDVKDKAVKAACDQIQTLWNEADARLSQTPFLAGNDCSAADILLAVFANWGFIPHLPTLGANVRRVVKAVSERPAFKKTLQTEKVDYKAAA